MRCERQRALATRCAIDDDDCAANSDYIDDRHDHDAITKIRHTTTTTLTDSTSRDSISLILNVFIARSEQILLFLVARLLASRAAFQ